MIADALPSARVAPAARGARLLAYTLAVLLVVGVLLTLALPLAADDGYRSGWLWWLPCPIAAAGFGAPAFLLLRRDPRSTMGLLLGLVALLAVAGEAATAWAWLAIVGDPGSLPGGTAALWLAGVLWFPAYFLLPTVLLLLAPDGRLASPRWRWPLGFSVFAIAATTVAVATSPYKTGAGADSVIPGQPPQPGNPLESHSVQHWLGWVAVLLPVCVALSIASLVLRRRRADGVERQQLNIVVVGALATVALMIVAFIVGRPEFLLVVAIALVPYPVALGIAARRHGLWDLDLVLRRSVVYAVLTTCVVAAYVVAIVLLGGALGRTTGAPLLATAVVAVGAAPLRARLQRAVDKRLFGDRADSPAAIRRLAERWESVASRDATASLTELARDVGRSLRLPFVRITTAVGVQGTFGSPTEPVSRLPLRHGGAVVGELLAGAREANRPLSGRDETTLGELAGYVAAIVHALRLTEDLQRSRERIVTAREEERRRLRRDLHDGLGPQLAAIALQLETVRDLSDGPDTPAGALAESLRAQLRGVIGEVRRIVDDLRPPVLDDLGLAEAMRQQCDGFRSPQLDVSAEIAPLPPLSAAVELAVLRIAGEALNNAARHARATRCVLTLRPNEGLLELAVTDNGDGLDASMPSQSGVGLASMRERALELGGSCTVEPAPGGGTTVRALLPALPARVTTS